MAKAHRSRPLPRTPGGPHDRADAPPAGGHDASTAAARVPTPPPAGVRQVPARPGDQEPPHLVKGTGCVGGHERGRELETRRLGRVPSARLTRVGFGLVIWCFAGSLFLAQGRFALLALQAILLWLALSAVVQRRAGHRGRCWRTRAWRHAWGGLVPGVQPRATRG